MSHTKLSTSIYKLHVSSLEDLKVAISKKSSLSETMPGPKKDKNFINLMPEEKEYYRTWLQPSKVIIKEFNFIDSDNDLTDNQVKIKYMSCSAKIEYPTRKLRNKDKSYLPKKDRLHTETVECYFFNFNSSIYAIIITSNIKNRDRTRNLIEYSISSKIKDCPDEFMLNSDIFNWMFYMFQEKDGKLSEKLTIEEITGFVGNVTDTTNTITGKSDQTLKLIVTKAFISNDGILKNISFRIRDDNNAEIIGTIDTSSHGIVNIKDSCRLQFMLPANSSNGDDAKDYIVLYVYGYLINKVKNIYIKATDDFKNNNERQFKKEIGLNVIESIIKKNNISKDELMTFFS